MSDSDLIKLAREQYDEADEATDNWRNQAREDIAFVGGDQWDAGVKAWRESQRLPCLTIDKIEGPLAQLVGDQRQNDIAIKIICKEDRQMVDTQGNEKAEKDFVAGMVREIQRKSKFGQIQSLAFQDAVTCGLGGWYIESQYAGVDTFDQELRIRRILTPTAIYPDVNGFSGDGMEYCHIIERIPQGVFKKRYPDASTQKFESNDPWYGNKDAQVSMWFCKEYDDDTLLMVQDESGIRPMRKSVLDKAEKEGIELNLQVLRERKIRVPKVMRRLITGAEVLETVEWVGSTIPVALVTGYEVWLDGRLDWRGVVRKAKDAQRLYNYYRSSVAEIMGAAPKAPYLMTPEMVKGQESHWATANVGNKPYLLYNPDPRQPGGPKREGQAYPQGMAQEAMIASDDIKATTKIYDAGLGARSNETSGRAILARQREGDTGNYVYPDNLILAVELTGRIIVEALPKIYDSTREVRTRDEDGTSQVFELNKQAGGEVQNAMDGSYDVEVTTGPAFATMRQESVEAMTAIAQTVPSVGQVGADIWIRNQDWPGADELAERLKRAVPPQLLDETDPQRQVAELKAKVMEMTQVIAQITGKPMPGMPQQQPQGVPQGMPMPGA